MVPIDREELAALVERASSIEGGNAGPLADAIRAAAEDPPAPATSEAGEIFVPPGYQEHATAMAQGRDERRVERAAKLPALAERARVKAALTRSLAQDAAGGPALDLGLLHRARSVGATTWMADLRAPDASALTQLADCFEGLADMADYVTLLPPPRGATNTRFVAAVRMMAAVLSAHRVTVLRFRQTPDEDQAAGFDWLRDTVAEERIFIAHHMRIDDPFDPARIPVLMSSIHVELRALREAEERREIRQRGLGQQRYHAGLLAEGYGTDHDRDKVLEAIERLVADGMPPSSLDLRNLLMPVRQHLRPAADPGERLRTGAGGAGRTPRTKSS